MSGVRLVTVRDDEAGLRLDRWFKRHHAGVSHAWLSRLLRTGQIRVDGARSRSGDRLEAGQRVRIPPLGESPIPAAAPRAEVDPADAARLRAAILHLDQSIIVINKPPGLAVQGGTGLHRHLDAMLDALCLDGHERPRLVHRLDKDTGGALVLGRSARATAFCTAAFRRRDARKLYWALVKGAPRPRAGTIRLSLDKSPGLRGELVTATAAGRSAVTDYRTIEAVGRRIAWLALAPKTGRTHQLRAHCVALGTPILGDRKYGAPQGAGAQGAGGMPGVTTLCLHARSIELPHPDGGRFEVVAPLSPPLRRVWERFGLDPDDGLRS